MELLCGQDKGSVCCYMAAKYVEHTAVDASAKASQDTISDHTAIKSVSPVVGMNAFATLAVLSNEAAKALGNPTLPILVTQDEGVLTYPLQILLYLSKQFLGKDRTYSNFEEAEILQWVSLIATKSYSVMDTAILHIFNTHLETHVFFANETFTIADIAVFTSIRDWVVSTQSSVRMNFPHIIRWFDYIQHLPEIQNAFQGFSGVNGLAVRAEPFMHLVVPKMPSYRKVDENNDNNVEEASLNTVTKEGKKTKTQPKKAKEPKGTVKTSTATDASKLPLDDVSRLEVRVGLIKHVKKHPEGDKLFIEQIDIGEKEDRTICSGLVGFISEENLVNQKCLVAANLKAKKFKGVASHGMILCAETVDKSKVELLFPPADTPIGELVYWEGYTGPFDDVLSVKPGKNPFVEIQPHFNTTEDYIACFKNTPFMTSCGPCRCNSIAGGIIL